MIQVEVAGPRLPQTFTIAPDDIRHLANEVLEECVYGALYIGGFKTSDLQVMQNWITAGETRLDRPFRMSHLTFHPACALRHGNRNSMTKLSPPAPSTAFLTVAITNPVPDWLSPGNYDPVMAYQFSQVEVEAIYRTYSLRERSVLRQRANRLRRQADKMQPRGSRVPWWENPGVNGEVNKTSVHTGDGTVSIELPKPTASDAGTATSKRRRRT